MMNAANDLPDANATAVGWSIARDWDRDGAEWMSGRLYLRQKILKTFGSCWPADGRKIPL